MPARFAQSQWSLEKTLTVTAILGLFVGIVAPQFVKAESTVQGPASVVMYGPAVRISSGGRVQRIDPPTLTARAD
jgi:hypothetical protein